MLTERLAIATAADGSSALAATALPAPSAGREDAEPRMTAATRLLKVLDVFGPRHRHLSLSDIARRAGLTLPTAHRLTRELLAWGGLERDADGRYSVGLRLLELSALAPRGLQLREAAFPFLDELHRITRGNVHLGVRDGREVVYLETLRARAERAVSSRVGDRRPMHATGTGLVLLAHADAEFQDAVLSSSLARFTPLTLTDPVELRRRLARIRQTGVAVARGQITVENLVVAVPVLGPEGAVTAAMSVVIPAARAKPVQLARLLARTSQSLSRRLADPGQAVRLPDPCPHSRPETV